MKSLSVVIGCLFGWLKQHYISKFYTFLCDFSSMQLGFENNKSLIGHRSVILHHWLWKNWNGPVYKAACCSERPKVPNNADSNRDDKAMRRPILGVLSFFPCLNTILVGGFIKIVIWIVILIFWGVIFHTALIILQLPWWSWKLQVLGASGNVALLRLVWKANRARMNCVQSYA